MNIAWGADAYADWRRLRFADAEAVATAVERWASTGEGLVYAAGGGEFRLFVGRHVVVFFVTEREPTMHVWHVHRA
ncbi:hypothetical protein [Pendulispora albinea]|uniref:Uncharacterized protein n=1 Tax=Pendulispora albinea TaxID=2741071 RepID=A0ABZ2M244_9BACT